MEINQSNIDNVKSFAVQNLIDFRIKEKEIEKYKSIEIENIDVSKKLQSISSGDISLIKEKILQYNLVMKFLKELRLQTAWQQLILMLLKISKINENEILIELTNLKNINSEIKTFHYLKLSPLKRKKKKKK